MIRVGSLITQQCERRSGLVHCSFSSSSDGNGSMAENFSESDEDYVNSSVIEAGMMVYTQLILNYLICLSG